MSTADRIGMKIRRARERLRMSQADLAAKLNVSRSAVNAWESGRAYPKNSIGALEAVLGVDLTGDGEPRPVEDRALQAIMAIPDLTEEEREAFVALALGMREAKRRKRREAG